MRPTTVAVSGVASNVGKTTLVCELLKHFPEWEAIKISRGHYRSCGKEPDRCCVGELLGERPVILSGRPDTYSLGKDTGRYWDAGARNVHWLICTNSQLHEGTSEVLRRVDSQGVIVEGTSFIGRIEVDFSILVVRWPLTEIKSGALKVLDDVAALYTCDDASRSDVVSELERRTGDVRIREKEFYSAREFDLLCERLRYIHAES